MTLVWCWRWDARIIEAGSFDGEVHFHLPREIHEAAERGELVPASRIELTITPDRRMHRRRSEDRK